MDIGVKEIRDWHLRRGFNDVGYHYVIRRDGTIEKGRDHEKVGAHARGHNSDSLGICLVGGMNEEGQPDSNFTMAQYEALDTLLVNLEDMYERITVHGHRDFSNKACPCFDITELLRYE
jgi:N-acetylmuramoyl-L-alanine amidase